MLKQVQHDKEALTRCGAYIYEDYAVAGSPEGGK